MHEAMSGPEQQFKAIPGTDTAVTTKSSLLEKVELQFEVQIFSWRFWCYPRSRGPSSQYSSTFIAVVKKQNKTMAFLTWHLKLKIKVLYNNLIVLVLSVINISFYMRVVILFSSTKVASISRDNRGRENCE